MNRRKALKILGALVCCFGGRISFSTEKLPAKMIDSDIIPIEPLDYIFQERDIGNIIIKCKDDSRLTFPFSEIVDALKTTWPLGNGEKLTDISVGRGLYGGYPATTVGNFIIIWGRLMGDGANDLREYIETRLDYLVALHDLGRCGGREGGCPICLGEND